MLEFTVLLWRSERVVNKKCKLERRLDWIPRDRRKRGRPRNNVDGRSTSRHDNKKFRTRSMEKQRGMAFGLRKTATAV